MFELSPSGWSERSLLELGSYVNGYAFKPDDWSEDGLPIVRIAQITGSSDTCDHYPNILSDTYKLKNDDIIFSWSGTLAVVKWSGGPAWLNQHLFRVDPAADVAPEFLYHLLIASVAEMDKRSHGSTMKHIKRGELREYRVPVPNSMHEQQKIAQILDALDTQIRQTEVLIAKLESIKHGLLTDLLTRGIDQNGQLRPAPYQAPHLYKDSPLGRIPREWEVMCLRGCAQKISDRDHTTPVYVESGVRMISPTNLVGYEGIDFEGCKKITRRAHQLNYRKTDLTPGDIIIHRIGAGLGRVRLVTSNMPEFSILHSMAQIRPDKENITSGYLLWALRIDTSLKQMGLGTQSIGVPDLGLDKIGGFQIPVAPLLEQDAIVARLTALSKRLARESSALGQLRGLKAGLMDDLLTGAVRVTPLLEANERATA